MTNKPKFANPRDAALCAGLIVLSIAGMAHTVLGSWSKTSGAAAKSFPRFVYCLILGVCALILLRELMGKAAAEPKALASVRWYHPLCVVGLGALFFEGVYYLGTAVSIFLFLAVMISLFSDNPKEELRRTLLISACATAPLWAIFTFVIPVMTPGQLLF